MDYKDMGNEITVTNVDLNQIEIDKAEYAISNAINNILSTQVGTVPGHPLFGCNVSKYLFEQMDPLIAKLIENEVRNALRLWESRIYVSNIEVKDDADYNRITVGIYYRILVDPINTDRKYIFTAQR